MEVFILQGIPGSGKSTLIKNVLNTLGKNLWVVSADQYFTREDGTYDFDPTKLGQAHDSCKRKFLQALQDPSVEILVVDNTNTTISEISIYYYAARARGHKVTVIRVLCDIEVALQRNTHGVPSTAIAKSHYNLTHCEIPSDWECGYWEYQSCEK